ncbi:SGNH/GDSL hydrolase family protein [Hwangdonia lutea]|uniref:SGNH/GDSL hydrolase family protein n=1 Tax=Hwangdonia lutea TaxID=3075823 RepID=A0AA97HPT3_9FLAO|nr:SGNH/GDSL hydrolase family protein [Hwangdonia sp. SCSIO 19198]WOD42180.1 SGNH/GDSL hydrolase family protein [Hwangdonia sp. SCSIO 19198]
MTPLKTSPQEIRQMVFFKHIIRFFICTSLFCSLESQSKHTEFQILFIGNSLTYSNNLPQLVKKQAKKHGVRVKTKMVAKLNYAISDHWDEGEVQKLIASKNYDFVIIQQGPSSQQNGKELLVDYGKKYRELCKNSQSKLVYFMVWPPINHPERFDAVINNHRYPAKINNAILCPVGEVWKKHFSATNNYDYYSADGFHPSKKGSEAAAKVIVEYLFPK